MELDLLHIYIAKEMFGRIGMTPEETALLGQTVKGSAKHLEIGTLWGGTAIFAALAGAGRVYSLDMMSGGWWDDGKDPKVNHPLGPKAVIDNLAHFKLQGRVALVVGLSNPFPLAGMTFTTVLIDGGHTLEAVQADWANIHPLTEEAVLFHDYDDLHPGIKQFLDSHQPEKDGWEMVEQVGTLRVYRPQSKKEEDVKPVSDDHHTDDPTPDTVPAAQPRKSKRTK